MTLNSTRPKAMRCDLAGISVMLQAHRISRRKIEYGVRLSTEIQLHTNVLKHKVDFGTSQTTFALLGS